MLAQELKNDEKMKGMDRIFEILYKVIEDIQGDGDSVCPIPLFSFEGLPGAGKTTQIKRVSEAMEAKYGKAYYIDLPTESSIGKILKVMYSDEKQWNEIRKENPWLNPVFLSVDLRYAIGKAIHDGSRFALMSRGVISTYYYNLDAYGDIEIGRAHV